MSVYAYLLCHDCKQNFWLGKVIHEDYHPIFFHIGNEKTPHWQREELNQVIWKFLADHTSHRIQVLMEHDMTDEFWDYQSIGGDNDETNDITVEEYLRDWRGLAP